MIKATLATIALAATAPLIAVQGYEIPFQGPSPARGEVTERRDTNLARYLAIIDNFDVQVGEGSKRYAVWITARLLHEFPDDDDLDDAGALYEIDAKTFTVLGEIPRGVASILNMANIIARLNPPPGRQNFDRRPTIFVALGNTISGMS